MSSIGVVVFRNTPLKTQVLQESVNNNINIVNNETNNVRREIVIVRKKPKTLSPSNAISVTSQVRPNDPNNLSALSKRPRFRENIPEESTRAPTPLAVARRNARERNRVRQVNDGFAALRRHIPDEVAAAFENANSNRGSNKKLSKVETLRMAVEYIRNLESLLNIGSSEKENHLRPSLESFPSPASSSPRETSQERSYYSLNSPPMDDDDIDEDELDSSIHQMPRHQYLGLPAAETFQLVSTPHLYEEEDGNGQPLTPSSDLLGQEDIHSHVLDGHFPFPSSAEQFSVIPDQNYGIDSEIPVNEEDFEVKYAHSINQQINCFAEETDLALESINPDLILNQNQYKLKEETALADDQQYSDIELKKELPDIQVTPEDREQFEETLKWWQEKTRQSRIISKSN